MAINGLSTIANSIGSEDPQWVVTTFAASTAATAPLPSHWTNEECILEIMIWYGNTASHFLVGNAAAKATSLVVSTNNGNNATSAGATNPYIAVSNGASPSANTSAHNFTVTKDTDDGTLGLAVHSNSNAAKIYVRRHIPGVAAY
jgi:hypothetical protein